MKLVERGRQTRDAKRIRNKSRLKLFVWSLEANTSYENELTRVLISSCVQRLIVCCEKSSLWLTAGFTKKLREGQLQQGLSRYTICSLLLHKITIYCITQQEAYKSVLIKHGKQMVFLTSINLFNEKCNGKA